MTLGERFRRTSIQPTTCAARSPNLPYVAPSGGLSVWSAGGARKQVIKGGRHLGSKRVLGFDMPLLQPGWATPRRRRNRGAYLPQGCAGRATAIERHGAKGLNPNEGKRNREKRGRGRGCTRDQERRPAYLYFAAAARMKQNPPRCYARRSCVESCWHRPKRSSTASSRPRLQVDLSCRQRDHPSVGDRPNLALANNTFPTRRGSLACKRVSEPHGWRPDHTRAMACFSELHKGSSHEANGPPTDCTCARISWRVSTLREPYRNAAPVVAKPQVEPPLRCDLACGAS